MHALNCPKPRANLTIASYNTSTFKIYNGISSQVRFGNKDIFFFNNALANYSAGVVVN
jgi:hypothetical protein